MATEFSTAAASASKKFTCHEDGSSDCPCLTHEKFRAPPIPKALAPAKVTLEAGKSLWMCSCGQSKNFPYCDGSHKAFNAANGTNYAPKQVTNETEASQDLWMCQCGHSKNRPFCDGSHKKVKEATA